MHVAAMQEVGLHTWRGVRSTWPLPICPLRKPPAALPSTPAGRLPFCNSRPQPPCRIGGSPQQWQHLCKRCNSKAFQ